MPQAPVYVSQSSSTARSIGPSSRASPVILTPTGGVSPADSITRQDGGKAAYMDLDKFYEDAEEEDESEESDSEEEDGEEGEEDTASGSGEDGESTEGEDHSEPGSDDHDDAEGDTLLNHVQGTTG